MSTDIISHLPPWSRDWARTRLPWYPEPIKLETWIGLRDWLGSLPGAPAGQQSPLYQMSMAQALDSMAKWQAQMAVRAARSALQRAKHGGNPDDIEVAWPARLVGSRSAHQAYDVDRDQGVDDTDWQWARITSARGLVYEQGAMGHRIGGDAYHMSGEDEARTFKDDYNIITLRDSNNVPHCTLMVNLRFREVTMMAAAGSQTVPERYQRAVAALLADLGIVRVNPTPGVFGHVLINGKLVHYSDIEPDTTIDGYIGLYGCIELKTLPRGLKIKGPLELWGCTALESLPDDIEVEGQIVLRECPNLHTLPPGLRVSKSLTLIDCPGLKNLPDGLRIGESLDIKNCPNLEGLPRGLFVDKYCTIEEAPWLTRLPDDIDTGGLFLRGCENLAGLPDPLHVRGGLDITDCNQLQALPEDLVVDGFLVMRCPGITRFPEKMTVVKNIVINRTPIERIPEGEDFRVGGIVGLDRIKRPNTATNAQLLGDEQARLLESGQRGI